MFFDRPEPGRRAVLLSLRLGDGRARNAPTAACLAAGGVPEPRPSFMRGAGPSRSPAEGSFMRGAGPSRSPAEGSEGVRVFGGRDVEAHGTWLAVADNGQDGIGHGKYVGGGTIGVMV